MSQLATTTTIYKRDEKTHDLACIHIDRPSNNQDDRDQWIVFSEHLTKRERSSNYEDLSGHYVVVFEVFGNGQLYTTTYTVRSLRGVYVARRHGAHEEGEMVVCFTDIADDIDIPLGAAKEIVTARKLIDDPSRGDHMSFVHLDLALHFLGFRYEDGVLHRL